MAGRHAAPGHGLAWAKPTLGRRLEWLTPAWWRRPVASILAGTIVLSLGKGAWVTCWAVFFIRFVGLSPSEFGFGITAVGVVAIVAGGALGYVADRVGSTETLTGLTIVQGLAVAAFSVVRGFWPIMIITGVMLAAQRAVPGVRIAVISGLTTDKDRLIGISTNRVASQSGIVVGSVIGGVVLAFDNRPAFLTMVLFYGAMLLLFAVLTAIRVPHVESLADRKVKRRVLALRDRPFLTLAMLNGLLALCWGMLDSGVPLWITHHTRAHLWIISVLMGLSAVVTVLFQNRVSMKGATVAGAMRLALWSGVALALSCAVFAATYHGSGVVVQAVLVTATILYVAGELCFTGSGFGLSVGLTPGDAHGEYQGVFTTGQSAALTLAPGIMAALLVGLGVAGWFVLAALYLIGGVGSVAAGRWALRSAHVDRVPADAAEPLPARSHA